MTFLRSYFTNRKFNIKGPLLPTVITLLISTQMVTPATTSAVLADGAVQLPVGQRVFKVEVDSEGIHEITAEDLIAKGMSSSLDPDSIQLMHYGEEVAWELVSDPTGNANIFDKEDKIRFYGWPFDESRAEKLYVNENIFWVIPGRTAARPSTVSASAGSSVIESVPHTQQFEYDDVFSTMAMTEVNWANQGVEPDHYFWLSLRRGSSDDSVTSSLTVDLTTPSSTTNNATVDAIIAVPQDSKNVPGNAEMILANNATATADFSPGDVFTMTQTISNNALIDGQNTVTFKHTRLDSDDPASRYYVNYLNVTYQKDLKADNGQLQFSYAGTGDTTFEISDFSGSTASEMAIWDVTDRKSPKQISATSNGNNSYRFNASISSTADFSVASSAGVTQIATADITAYTPKQLDPAAGYADWLAIAPEAFLDINGTSNDLVGLAEHRQT
ncbi:MAG: hypothetical protein AAGD96_30050, partial [Chloroflexota bacterium]